MNCLHFQSRAVKSQGHRKRFQNVVRNGRGYQLTVCHGLISSFIYIID